MSLQFKAFANPYPSTEGSPYLVVLQNDLLDEYRSVLVAPLQPASTSAKSSRLRPRFDIAGVALVLNVLEMAPMPRAHLGPAVADLDRFRIIDAYDAVISGAWS